MDLDSIIFCFFEKKMFLKDLVKGGSIGVARIFDWGAGPKLQITCNDVTRNFRKRNFLWVKDSCRLEDQKPWLVFGS